MLVRSLRPASKSKLVSAFHSSAQSMSCYVRCCAAVTPNFPKETKCKPICMPGSSFMHIVTYNCIQKQYHVRKREIIRDLRLILETKAPNIRSSRLGVAYA
jgi:hypothetical protein